MSAVDLRERTLTLPAAMGVTSVEKSPLLITRLPAGVWSGQMFEGVIRLGADDVGVGSRLLGQRLRRGAGAKGHTAVRHAVDATLMGVFSGIDCGDALAKPPQDAGAGRTGFC